MGRRRHITAVVRNGEIVFDLLARLQESATVRGGFLRQSLPHDLVLDSHQTFQQRFGARGAAGNIDVDRYNQIDALHDVIPPLEIRAATHRACTHGNHELGVGHHVVQSADAAGHFVGHRSRDNHQVRLPRSGTERPSTKAVQVVTASSRCHHFDSTTSQTKRHRPNTRLSSPIDRLFDGRRQDIFFDPSFDPGSGHDLPIIRMRAREQRLVG